MTNSVLDARHVVGKPTILHLPPDVHSLAAADEAIEWGECYGLTLDADQQMTLRAGLGERLDGSWAASEVADFKGRQAGKNDTAKVRQGAGIDLFGERLMIHTAHEFATANEDFLRLVAVYEAYDDLRKSVSRIRYANGEQGIEFLNGARIKYRARTGGAGRGFTKADVVFYDEAQHLKPEHLGASFPTMLASPNFQAWYMGSGGFSDSVQAWLIRRRAILGAGGRLAYTENTAQIINVSDGKIVLSSPADLMAEEVLLTHPGYAAGRVSLETMQTMFDALGVELFGREILNIWEPEPGDEVESAIPAWPTLVDGSSLVASNLCWALSVSPDRKWSSIGVAGRRADGRVHVEWIAHDPGTDWIVDRVAQGCDGKHIPIRIHKSGPEGSLIDPLRERGVEVIEVSSAEAAQATGQLIDAATNGQLAHLGQPSLNKAVRGAVLRMSSDGAVLWSQRQSTVEITPLQAVTIALGGVPAPTAGFWFA